MEVLVNSFHQYCNDVSDSRFKLKYAVLVEDQVQFESVHGGLLSCDTT